MLMRCTMPVLCAGREQELVNILPGRLCLPRALRIGSKPYRYPLIEPYRSQSRQNDHTCSRYHPLPAAVLQQSVIHFWGDRIFGIRVGNITRQQQDHQVPAGYDTVYSLFIKNALHDPSKCTPLTRPLPLVNHIDSAACTSAHHTTAPAAYSIRTRASSAANGTVHY